MVWCGVIRKLWFVNGERWVCLLGGVSGCQVRRHGNRCIPCPFPRGGRLVTSSVSGHGKAARDLTTGRFGCQRMKSPGDEVTSQL